MFLGSQLDAGLDVSLRSDDPAYFESRLAATYASTAHHLGLGRATLVALAANGIRASFLPPSGKPTLLDRLHGAAASALREQSRAQGAQGAVEQP